MPIIGIWGKVVPALMIGAIAGLDNVIAALAIGTLVFTGPLASGLGLGVGVLLLGGTIITLIVAIRSVVPNSIALVQETTIAILAAVILSMAMQSSGSRETDVATAVAIIGVSSLTTGVLFWITGRLRIGRLVRFLPYPVVAGFLASSGWLLLEGSLKMLTGGGLGLHFLASLNDINTILRVLPAIIFAGVAFVAISRFKHSATMPIIMIMSAIVFYSVLWLSDFPAETARDLGHLPPLNISGNIDLPTPDLLTRVDWGAVMVTAPSLLVIAGLSMVGLMLNISGLELASGRDIDVNAELRSTGIANIFSGSVGGPSGFVGLSMTLLAEKTGVTGRGAGIATALFMLLGLFAAGSMIFQVPIFLTAGFVMFLGMELLKEWLIDTRYRMPISEWLIVVLILSTVALVGLTEAIAVGLLLSSAVFVFKYSRLPVVRLRATGDIRRSTVDRSLKDTQYLSEHGEAIEVIQLQGYLFFGTSDRVVDLVRTRLADVEKRPLRFIILDFDAVSGADSAAITGFLKIRKLVEDAEIAIVFTRLPQELQNHLSLAGVDFGTDSLMQLEPDLDHALEKAEDSLLGDLAENTSDDNLLKHFVDAIGPHPRLHELIDRMTRLVMQPEDVLTAQGEDASDTFFVAKGRVRVQITLPDGKVIRIRKMLAGAIVGEIAFYLNQPRGADVIVDAPSEIFQLSADMFRRLEFEDPQLAILAHRLMASNLSEKLSVANKSIQLAHG